MLAKVIEFLYIAYRFCFGYGNKDYTLFAQLICYLFPYLFVNHIALILFLVIRKIF